MNYVQAIIVKCTRKLSSTISCLQVVRLVTRNLEFEKTVMIRDRIIELRKDEELVSPMVK